MNNSVRELLTAPAAVTVMALLLALGACGGGKESTGDAAAGGGSGQSASAGAGNSSAGPDTSGLADFILARINADPTRQELKVTGKLLEFNIVSSVTEEFGNLGASTVVECAGVAVFDGDVSWSWMDTEPRKAGEPAKFECRVEYANQGKGWEIFGPVGISPI